MKLKSLFLFQKYFKSLKDSLFYCITADSMDSIIIKGARENNLKNIDLTLPRNKMIVITGVSGSGKSSLAFDTLYAESQRRYLESLSSYARQFLGQMQKPDVDSIEGLSPSIAIDQKSASHNPRSTVGTVTEIHDYLRLLYAKIGTPHCAQCDRPIMRMPTEAIVDRILDLEKKFTTIEILAPIVRNRTGEYLALLNELFQRGYKEAYINGKKYDLEEVKDLKLARYKKHSIDAVVDKVAISAENLSRIFEDVERALRLSEGLVKIKSGKEEILYNQRIACPLHDVEFPPLEPRFFSFNSPYGACPECEGLGSKKKVDSELLVADRARTIAEGGILAWTNLKNTYLGMVLRAVLEKYEISENTRIEDIADYKLKILLYGDDSHADNEVIVRYGSAKGRKGSFKVHWRGLAAMLEERYRKTESDAVRRDIEQYMSSTPCLACGGARFKSEALLVTVGDKNIAQLSKLSVHEGLKFFKEFKLSNQAQLIASRILQEIIQRLAFLDQVGLGYLSLDRAAMTLSGGEMQRIRLASQLGSQLVGVLYILDEPSIGLHARDHQKLLAMLHKLRDLGNTLIVVEHDEQTMLGADWLVDMGPLAGKQGGEVVAAGAPYEIIKTGDSLTARYLRKDLEIAVPL